MKGFSGGLVLDGLGIFVSQRILQGCMFSALKFFVFSLYRVLEFMLVIFLGFWVLARSGEEVPSCSPNRCQ